MSILTDREMEIAFLVCDGLTNGAIGKRLGVNETTVKTHVSRMLRKLGLENRAALAVWAERARKPPIHIPAEVLEKLERAARLVAQVRAELAVWSAVERKREEG